MRIRHTFLVGMCASLLTLALFGFGLFGSVYMIAGRPGPIKGALRESGIYQTGIGDALDQAQKGHPDQHNDAIPTDKPEVRDIVKQAFPSEYVQGQSEHALDATYAWLQGKTPKLAFSIDLTDAKTRLANGMAAYVQHRTDTLPVCTAGAMPSGEVDAFNAACLPPGFDKAEAAAKARDDVVSGDFLKDSKFDADTVKNNSGKTLSQQLQAVPKVYQYLLLSIAMLGGSSLLLGAGVVLLGGNWRAGLRRLGVITAVVGAFTAALGWTSSFVIHKATIEFAKSESGSQPLQQKVMRIVELLVNDLRGLLVGYGITLVVLGAAAIVAWYFLRRSGSVAEAESLAGGGEPIKTTKMERLPAPRAGRTGAKPKLPEIKK